MNKIIIVGDVKIISLGLEALLINYDYKILSICLNFKELTQYLSNNEHPDIILLDVNLKNEDGIKIGKFIRIEYENIKLLALISFSNRFSILEFLNVGFNGFITKASSEFELKEALQTVLQGKPYFSKDIAHFLKNKNTINKKIKQFTAREIEIIRLFAEGFSYKDIATYLSISVSTVDSHKYNIMRKLNTKSSLDIVKFAIKEKIIIL